MNEDFDPDVAARFAVVDSIPVPDTRPAATRNGNHNSNRLVPSHRWMLPLTAVACLAALISGLVAVTATRADSETEPATGVATSTCEAEGRCAFAQWDATSIEGSVIDFVYYVDAECSGTLLGTQFDETSTAVDISVLVAIDPETECSGTILQRSGSVLLQQPVQDLDGPNPQRTLTGCRNPTSPVASPASAGSDAVDCRVEITSRFPQYPSDQLRAEHQQMLDEIGIDEVLSEPIDIDAPGTYEIRAYIDPTWDIDGCGWGYGGPIDDFVEVSINEDRGDSGIFDVKYDENNRPFVTWTAEVYEVTFPVEGFFVSIGQCS